MKFDEQYVHKLEDVIREKLLPVYMEYHRQNKLKMPDLDALLVPLLRKEAKVPMLCRSY